MAFILENIPEGSAIQSSDIHRKAVSIAGGLPIGARAADRSRSAYLYQIWTSSIEEMPPGEYVLFVDGEAIRVLAHEKRFKSTGPENVVRYVIREVAIPAALEGQRDSILGVLKESFEVLASYRSRGPQRVEVVMR